MEFDVIKNASSYEEATSYIENTHISAGIYFLDIEIGKKLHEKNGIDLGEVIKEKDEKSQLIFITSHEDMAFLTFERRLGAIDFIVKSSDLDKTRARILYAIENAIDKISKFDYIKRNTFSYRFGQEIKNISLDDVIYITTTNVGHKLQLVKKTGWAEFIGSLKDIPTKYSQLVQISQSCVINPHNVQNIDLKEKKIIFINGDIEYFSVRNTRKVKTLFKM